MGVNFPCTKLSMSKTGIVPNLVPKAKFLRSAMRKHIFVYLKFCWDLISWYRWSLKCIMYKLYIYQIRHRYNFVHKCYQQNEIKSSMNILLLQYFTPYEHVGINNSKDLNKITMKASVDTSSGVLKQGRIILIYVPASNYNMTYTFIL